MSIVDYIAISAIALIVGGAVFYIVRAKRRGEKCVGCPYSKSCCGKCGTQTECGKGETQNEEK